MGVSSDTRKQSQLGSDSLLRALELLSNPEELSQRLADFVAAEDRAREALALVGPANEILELRRQVEEQRADAAKARVAADAEIERMLEEAREESGEIVREARSVADQTRALADKALKDAQAAAAKAVESQKANEAKAAELDKLRTELEGRIADAKLKSAEADEIRIELDAERVRLRKVADTIAAQVG